MQTCGLDVPDSASFPIGQAAPDPDKPINQRGKKKLLWSASVVTFACCMRKLDT